MADVEVWRKPIYDAFVSYRHDVRDQVIVNRLQSALHGFARPFWKYRAVRLYRDSTSLDASENLWATIQAALDISAHFILLASPASAASPWVRRERRGTPFFATYRS